MIVVITGTPGTGKSSVAKELGKLRGWKVLSVGDIVRKKKLFLGFDRRRKVPVADVKKLSSELKRRLEKDSIVEGHYACLVCKADWIFALRCNPKVLRKRLLKRGYGRKKIEENLLCEMLDLCSIEAGGKVWEIETAWKSAKDVAVLIGKAIDGKIKCGDKVDYSELLGKGSFT